MILFLVIYTAIFTPYVAAFLLNEPGYSDRSSESYGSDPIVIIDLIGNIKHLNIKLQSRAEDAQKVYKLHMYLIFNIFS